MRGELGDLLSKGGAVVGGGAALGAALGFLAGSVAQDLGLHADPERFTRRGAQLGGVFGLAVLLIER